MKVYTHIYTHKGYVLGVRCVLNHSGNRRLAYDRREPGYAECVGCGSLYVAETLPRFFSRREALRADREVGR